MHFPSFRFCLLLLPCVVSLLCCLCCGTGSSTDKTEIIDHVTVGDYTPVRAALQQAIDCDGPLLPERGNVHLLHSYVRRMTGAGATIGQNALERYLPLQGPDTGPLTSRQLDWVRDALVMHRLARTICRGAASDEDRVRRIMGWVFDHVAPGFPLRGTGPDDLAALPYAILERGFGLCDRMAWVFCSLAAQQGLQCNVVYLFGRGSDASGHTIVNVAIDGQPVLIDPFNCIVFHDPATGVLLGTAALAADPATAGRVHPMYADATHPFEFARSIHFLTFHPLSVHPKMRLLEKFFQKPDGTGPVLYVDVEKELQRYDTLFHANGAISAIARPDGPGNAALPGRQGMFAVWDYAMRLPAHDYYANVATGPLSRMFAWRGARALHLAGRLDAARTAYRARLASVRDAAALDDIAWFLGQLEYDAGDCDAAIAVLESYLDRGPGRMWSDHAAFLLWRCFRKTGQDAQAAQMLTRLQEKPNYAVFTDGNTRAGSRAGKTKK